MPGKPGEAVSLVFVFRFILVVLIFRKVAVLGVFIVFFVLFVFIVFFVDVIGNGIQRHGMRLRHFQFALALRTAQDFSLFHFVLVHIDFSGTFRATEHVSILRVDFQPAQLEIPGPHQPAYYIPGECTRSRGPFTGYSV